MKKIILITTFLIYSILIFGQTADDYINKGNAYAEQWDFDKAIPEYDKAIELSPDNAKIYYLRGYAKENLEDRTGAINDFAMAIKLNPADTASYYEKAMVEEYIQKYDDAIVDISKFIELVPDDAYAYILKASCEAKVGNYETSVKDYTKALSLNPENEDKNDIYLQRAYAYIEIKDYSKAIDDFNTLLKEEPQNSRYLTKRGYAKKLAGDFQGALADANKAIEQNNPEGNYLRGLIYFEQGNYKDALVDFKKVTNVYPFDEALFYQGKTHYALKNYQEAITDFDKLLKVNPKYKDAYFERGNAKYKAGKKKEACADWKTAKENKNPKAEKSLEKYCK